MNDEDDIIEIPYGEESSESRTSGKGKKNSVYGFSTHAHKKLAQKRGQIFTNSNPANTIKLGSPPPNNYISSQERRALSSDREYSAFRNVDPKDESFIGNQKKAGIGVASCGATGYLAGIANPEAQVFNLIEALALTATGAGNAGRNHAWWKSINPVTDAYARFSILPRHCLANTLDRAGNIFGAKSIGAPWKEKARTIRHENNVHIRRVRKRHKNPIGRDITKSKLSEIALWGGSAIHIPQFLMGVNMAVQDGAWGNGHMWGAGLMIPVYATFAVNKRIERPRLLETLKIFPNIQDDTWTNAMRHEAIGHIERGKYGMQAALIAASAGVVAKGVFYGLEAHHIDHSILDTVLDAPKHIPELPSKIMALTENFNMQSMIDHAQDIDVAQTFNALGSFDYSNILLAGSALSMYFASIVFTKSGWNELMEDTQSITKFGFRRFVKDPINEQFDQWRHSKDLNDWKTPLKRSFFKSEEKIRSAQQKINEESPETVYGKLLKKTKKAGLSIAFPIPSWVTAEPYNKQENRQIIEEVVRVFDPNDITDVSQRGVYTYLDHYADLEEDDEYPKSNDKTAASDKQAPDIT